MQPLAALNPRGLRSRERLKRAARELLNERGFRQLRVQDVTAHAGVASGLYYRYFHDLREIVEEISRDFFAELLTGVDPDEPSEHRYDWIFDNLSNVVRRFAQNPGILACLFGMAGDSAEFDQIWKENAHRWNLRVAEYLRRELRCDAAHARRMGFMLGAMTEGVVYQALIRQTEDLVEMGEKPEDIADVLAVMWYRAIYLEDPPLERLRPAGRRLIGTKIQRTRKRTS
ncbi:MAG TPA: TetR/AcrR family transcriptional regulator [Gemmatimonadaceae bacterium]|nr:TetR/AcrR family transcriptional regulator [Gemmatimonadaceae bacterium]